MATGGNAVGGPTLPKGALWAFVFGLGALVALGGGLGSQAAPPGRGSEPSPTPVALSLVASADTFLDALAPNTAQGRRGDLKLWPGLKRPLLAFDLRSVPAASQIVSATLRLCGEMDSPGSLVVEAYQVRREWLETAATWYWAGPVQQWGVPGADQVPGDRLGVPASVRTVDRHGCHTWDVTVLAQAWLDDPGRNTGVLLLASGHGQFGCYSREYQSMPGVQPQLRVLYLPASAGPTATPSPTPTPACSPTASPSPTPTATPGPLLGQVWGRVWEDVDRDGTIDEGEGPVSNAILILRSESGQPLAYQATGLDGRYGFRDLAAGRYLVEEIDPPGYLSSTPNLVGVLLQGNVVRDLDFGDFCARQTHLPAILRMALGW